MVMGEGTFSIKIPDQVELNITFKVLHKLYNHSTEAEEKRIISLLFLKERKSTFYCSFYFIAPPAIQFEHTVCRPLRGACEVMSSAMPLN